MSAIGVKRWTERTPSRYEASIACLTLGRGDRMLWTIAQRWIAPGDRLLHLGNGTGLLPIECALKGALVTTLNANPSMLARAREYARRCGLEGFIYFVEADPLLAEDILGEEKFDVITATFLLSDLLPDERRNLLRQVENLLKPAGRFIVADELVPAPCLRRALAASLRWPLVALAGLISGHISYPLKGFEASLIRSGWRVRSRRTLLAGTIGVLVLEKSVKSVS